MLCDCFSIRAEPSVRGHSGPSAASFLAAYPFHFLILEPREAQRQSFCLAHPRAMERRGPMSGPGSGIEFPNGSLCRHYGYDVQRGRHVEHP